MLLICHAAASIDDAGYIRAIIYVSANETQYADAAPLISLRYADESFAAMLLPC